MVRTTGRWVLLAVMALAVCGVAAAGQAGGADEEPQVVKVAVKQYTELPAERVYELALRGIQANVRFSDPFDGVASAVRQVELNGYTYQTALAFRTETNLVCVVARSNAGAIRSLLAVPPNQPLTPAILNRPIALNSQQRITIEGTILGTAAGSKYVLADAVLTGAEQRETVHREVHLSWGALGEKRVMTEPGSEVFTFPCSYVTDQTVGVKVNVQQTEQAGLLQTLAQAQAQSEGLQSGTKLYGEYDCMTVYRRAAAPERLNVDFADQVATLPQSPPSGPLSTVPVVRAGRVVDVPVSYLFRTECGLTCMVPATSEGLTGSAEGLLPGELVRVRGTVVGPRGSSNCVVIDYVGPANPEEDEKVWLVTIEFPNTGKRVFWDYGLYTLADLPCQYAPGRAEVLQVLISDFRSVQVPRRAAAAPAQ